MENVKAGGTKCLVLGDSIIRNGVDKPLQSV
jgi:hypothetical protein